MHPKPASGGFYVGRCASIINAVAVNTSVAVITVAWNSGAVLGDFLGSLAAQTGVPWHLYAVDNASTDSTPAQLRAFAAQHVGRVTVIESATNTGAAEGNNLGVRAAMAAGHELLLLTNNDVAFDAELFSTLVAALRDSGCDLVCPQIRYHHRPDVVWFAGGEFQRWAGHRTVHFGQGQRHGAQHDVARVVTYAPTTCLLVGRRVFEQTGLLDEAYFAYNEDADLLHRARLAGFRTWYCPQAVVLHKVSSLAGHESAFAGRYGTRNRIYFLRKHYGTVQAAFWGGIYLAYCGLRLLTGQDSLSRFRIKAAGWREGWQIPTAK